MVHLKIWENLTFARIAEILGIPANTAASRYRYAMDRLRQILPHPLPSCILTFPPPGGSGPDPVEPLLRSLPVRSAATRLACQHPRSRRPPPPPFLTKPLVGFMASAWSLIAVLHLTTPAPAPLPADLPPPSAYPRQFPPDGEFSQPWLALSKKLHLPLSMNAAAASRFPTFRKAGSKARAMLHSIPRLLCGLRRLCPQPNLIQMLPDPRHHHLPNLHHPALARPPRLAG